MDQPTGNHEDTRRLAAILVMTAEALQELLHLPPGAYIDSVHSPHDRPGTLDIRIRGAGWPCDCGKIIQRTTAIVKVVRDDEGREISRVVDWGLPGADATSSPSEKIQMGACPHGVPHRWPCEECDTPMARLFGCCADDEDKTDAELRGRPLADGPA